VTGTRRHREGFGPVVSAVAAVLCAGAALGADQDTVPATGASVTAGTPLDEIIVTGSHIKAANLAPVVNVQQIDRVQLQQSGASQMVDLIKEIPSNSGTTQYNENGQLSGTAQFELRGLGFSSTLVLLNGRRAGVAPLSDKSGADFVDINQFPLAMVQRIDVLKDGSSAIYGSEAVAGVVNIVTRKGFEGLELSAEGDSSTNRSYSINLASGHKFDGGSINLYATYYHQTGNMRSDFPWLVERVGGNGIPGLSQLINNNGFPGTYQLATSNAAGRPTAVSGAPTVADPNCQAAGGVFPISATGVVNSSTCDVNFEDQIAVIPDENRLQAFVEADYDLTSKLSYFNETSGSRNNNFVTENPGSYANGAAVGGLIYVPANAPFNFFIADPSNPKNIVAVNPSQWNPTADQAVAVVGNFRPQGPYISAAKEQTDTYFRTVNGFNLSLAHNWNASLSHQYAYAEYQELNPLAVNATELNTLIAGGQYNPFGTAIVSPTLISPKNGVGAANPQSVINQIFYTSNLTRRTEQNVVDLSASGPALTLPTGPVYAAVGVQYRRQTLKYLPDTLAAAGQGSTSVTDAPFSGMEHVLSQYAEAIIPIEDRSSVQAAIRHEDYGAGIGSTTNPKLTGRLNFFSGLLALRGSWGTSFQAPTDSRRYDPTAFSGQRPGGCRWLGLLLFCYQYRHRYDRHYHGRPSAASDLEKLRSRDRCEADALHGPHGRLLALRLHQPDRCGTECTSDRQRRMRQWRVHERSARGACPGRLAAVGDFGVYQRRQSHRGRR